jgi:hypothetical protein
LVLHPQGGELRRSRGTALWEALKSYLPLAVVCHGKYPEAACCEANTSELFQGSVVSHEEDGMFTLICHDR